MSKNRHISAVREADVFNCTPGYKGMCEDDTHADTHVFGANFRMVEDTGEEVDVVPFSDDFTPMKDIPIVTAVTAAQCPDTGEVVLLHFPQGLWYGRRMNHSLINPNQLRHFGIAVSNDPTDKNRFFGIDTQQDFRIPFTMSGSIAGWESWCPSDDEMSNPSYRHIQMCDDDAWIPSEVTIGMVTTTEEEELRRVSSISEHPAGTPVVTWSLFSDDEIPILDDRMFAYRAIHAVQVASVSQPLTDDDVWIHEDLSDPLVRVGAVGAERRHSKYTAQELARKWGCGLETAQNTLKKTTQRNVRHALHPLHQRYRVDHLNLNRRRLNTTMYTDTLFARTKSLRQNTCAQVYTNGKFTQVYPMRAETGDGVGQTLTLLTEDVGIPDTLVYDLAAVQEGSQTHFQKEVRRLKIKTKMAEKGHHQQNWAAEQEILGLKRRWKALMMEKDVPKRLWDYGIVYMAEIMSRTARGDNLTPGLEELVGHTIDVSEWLDFGFYDLVWWWDPTHDETTGDPKRLGRWLGVAHRIGSEMCYWILTDACEVVARTTVQHVLRTELLTDHVKTRVDEFDARVKDRLDDDRFLIEVGLENALFYLEDVETPQGMEVGEGRGLVSPEEAEYGDMWFNKPDVEHDNVEIYDKYLNAQITLDRGGEQEKGRVIRRRRNDASQAIGTAHDNPMFDTREYEVELDDGSIDVITANNIAASIYSQCDTDGWEQAVLQEITSHKRDDSAIRKEDGWSASKGVTRRKVTTKGWKLLVEWKGGATSWIPLVELKDSHPIELAEYARANRIDDEPAFAWWVPHTLRINGRFLHM